MSRCPTCSGAVCTPSSSSSSSSVVPNCVRLVAANPEIFIKKLIEVTKERDHVLEQREKYEAFLGELSNKFSGITGKIDKLHSRVGELESAETNSALSQVEAHNIAAASTSEYNDDNNGLALPARYPSLNSGAQTYSKDWDEDCDDLIDSDLEEAAEATTQRWMHANTPNAAFRTETAAVKVSNGNKGGTVSICDKPPSKDIISGYVNGLKNNKQRPRNLINMVEEVKKARVEKNMDI